MRAKVLKMKLMKKQMAKRFENEVQEIPHYAYSKTVGSNISRYEMLEL